MVLWYVSNGSKLVIRLGKQELDRSPRTTTVLFNNDFDFTDVGRVGIVLLLGRTATLLVIVIFPLVFILVVTVEETDNIGILLN